MFSTQRQILSFSLTLSLSFEDEQVLKFVYISIFISHVQKKLFAIFCHMNVTGDSVTAVDVLEILNDFDLTL